MLSAWGEGESYGKYRLVDLLISLGVPMVFTCAVVMVNAGHRPIRWCICGIPFSLGVFA